MNHNNIPRTFTGDLINAKQKASRAKELIIDTAFTNKETEYPFLRKASRMAIVAGLGAAGTFGINLMSEPGNTNPDRYQEYQVENAGDVQIEEGAHIRHDPTVERQEGGNVAHTTEEDLSISVPSSFLKEDWRNGEWIGVDADALSEELGHTIKDGDGILWINEQKAYVKSDTSENQE